LIAEFICQSPRLLEYNVKKRLVPRFDRVKELLNVNAVNVVSLRAIATSTDSRFEEWLQKEMELIGHESPVNIIESTLPDDNRQGPLAFVVMSNLQSGGNIGNIVRSASIFGVTECVVVGQKRYRLTGDHGARFDLPRRHMWSHSEARDYLKKTIGGVRIYGIEIMPDAAPIMQYDQETGVMRFPFDRQWADYSDAPREGEKFVAVPGTDIKGSLLSK
jgi:tRNA G18 (ribose-2'-O)-methylase SpoU